MLIEKSVAILNGPQQQACCIGGELLSWDMLMEVALPEAISGYKHTYIYILYIGLHFLQEKTERGWATQATIIDRKVPWPRWGSWRRRPRTRPVAPSPPPPRSPAPPSSSSLDQKYRLDCRYKWKYKYRYKQRNTDILAWYLRAEQSSTPSNVSPESFLGSPASFSTSPETFSDAALLPQTSHKTTDYSHIWQQKQFRVLAFEQQSQQKPLAGRQGLSSRSRSAKAKHLSNVTICTNRTTINISLLAI